MGRPRSVSLGDGSELSLIEVEPSPVRRRRIKYVHVHTPEELAAFERSKAIADQIRGLDLSPAVVSRRLREADPTGAALLRPAVV